MVYSMNFQTGKLEPVESAMLPVGTVCSYRDIANPRQYWAVIDGPPGPYGQPIISETGRESHISRNAIMGPGGWNLVMLGNGEPRVLSREELTLFVVSARNKRKRLDCEAEKRKREEAEAKEHERARILAEFPHLEPASTSTKSSHALAAANIRRELARAFPGVKFSVRSDCYSGGDSVHVKWALGPKSSDVEEICNKYTEGHFNGMEDIYEYNRAVWPEVFGGAKYIFCNREEGDLAPIVEDLCKREHVECPPRERWYCVNFQDRNRTVGEIARDIVLSFSYPPGATLTGLELNPDDNSGVGLASIYRPTFTA